MNDLSTDGLMMLPRVGEPETSFAGAEKAAGGPSQLLAPNTPDTSGPGPVSLQEPAAWIYDFDPATGMSRATFNGVVSFSEGGGPGAGVTSWNGQTGAVVMEASDLTAAGGLVNPSVALTGTPTAPTASPGTSSTQLATTQFVAQAIVAGAGVTSFNGRQGAIALTTGDVTNAGGAPSASPALTGVPTAPTGMQGDTSSQIATNAFVANALASGAVTTFNGRRGAVSLTLSDVESVGGAPIASPVFTGVPAAPTAPPGTATTQIASTAFVTNAIVGATTGVSSVNTRTGAVVLNPSDLAGMGGAPLNSPVLTGNPAAPTPTAGDNSTRIATTAYVETAIGSLPPGVATFNGRQGTVTLQLADVTSVGGAPLASPTFTGSPQTTTPPPGDNSLRIADTAFVAAAIPAPSNATPSMNGTGAAGSATTWSRGDHVHPTDTSRAAASALANYLPLTGGTLSGNLVVQGLYSGTFVSSAGIQSDAGTIISQMGGGATTANFVMANASGGVLGSLYHDGNSLFGNNNVGSGQWYITNVPQFVVNCAPYSPGGGVWNAISDARIKTVEGDYAEGLAKVLQLRPVVYSYRGNDAPPGGRSPNESVLGRSLVGFVAQDLETAFPDMVSTSPGFIDGERVADLRSVNVSNLIYALVNAVKELNQRIGSLEAAKGVEPEPYASP